MAKPAFPFTLPSSLSPSTTFPVTADIDIWDVGIAGVGFMLSTLDQDSPFEFRSYEVQSIPVQKPRIDDAEEPGEQTLSGWWARAQHSWHEGAGQHIFDSPFSSRFRFCESRGVDIWKTGELSLLKDTEELRNDAVNDHHLLATPNALFYTHDGNLTRDPDPDSTGETDEDTESSNSGTGINSITSDGTSIYAAFEGGSVGIQACPIAGAMAWSLVNDLKNASLIGFLKGRLIGAKDNSLYEFDLNDTNEPDPFYSDPQGQFEWVSMAEAGPAIYFAGGLENRSEIYASRLTLQDLTYGAKSTLGALRSVWESPAGEQILTIEGYLGKQILIGTNRGLRVGTVSTEEGDLDVSPLLTYGDHGDQGPQSGVKAVATDLDWAWFGWDNLDSTYSGTGRIHLGELTWASDVMYEGQGEVMDVVRYDGRVYFVLDEGATSRIIKEHATDLEPSGWFRNCQIRFATTERKTVRYFDILTQGNGLWSVALRQNDGDFNPFASDNPTGGYTEEIVDLEATRFGVEITLKRNQSDATDGPALLEWRLKAEPRVSGRFRYLVPIMVYDFITAGNGSDQGKVGRALELLLHLMDIYRSDEDFLFQGPETKVPGAPDSQLVKMEDLRFKEYAPPNGSRGYGGIALAIFREVR